MAEKIENKDIFGKAIPQLIHDLRNPLNIIVGFSSIIQIDSSVSPEVQSYLKKIAQSGMLIEQLLSNVDCYMMDNIVSNENRYDVTGLIDSFFDLKNDVFTEKHVCFEKHLEQNLVSMISLDIFNRILENFYQFSMKGFNNTKEKIIQIVLKKEDNDFVIYYTDSTEPTMIEGDYFSFDDLIKAKRGLGLEFNRKFISDYNGTIVYRFANKWHDIQRPLPMHYVTNHGFIMKMPIK
jgi:K+-sensing histidine kinase KdpD